MIRSLTIALACLIAGLVCLPASAAQPVLVVYPFAVSGTTSPDLGAALVDHIAAEITSSGGVTVVNGAASAKPSEYRSAAKAAGADMYYSGSIASVGSRYAAIEQLVSTKSGTVMWSTTMQFQTVADVTGEGARVHDEVLHGARPVPQSPDQPSP